MNSDNTTPTTTYEQINSAVDSSFFYTNEKFIKSLDVDTVIEYLWHNYPLLNLNSTDSQIKKTLLEMLSNDEFMNNLLDVFNLSIFEFFKFLTVHYGALFKGAFLKKIKKEISLHSYGRRFKTDIYY